MNLVTYVWRRRVESTENGQNPHLSEWNWVRSSGKSTLKMYKTRRIQGSSNSNGLLVQTGKGSQLLTICSKFY